MNSITTGNTCNVCHQNNYYLEVHLRLNYNNYNSRAAYYETIVNESTVSFGSRSI